MSRTIRKAYVLIEGNERITVDAQRTIIVDDACPGDLLFPACLLKTIAVGTAAKLFDQEFERQLRLISSGELNERREP